MLKPGDRVVVAYASPLNQTCYAIGDEAILLSSNPTGIWEADFRDCGNKVVHSPGVWLVGDASAVIMPIRPALEPWQTRVLEERSQLWEKLIKLRAFKLTDTYQGLSSLDTSLLLDQEEAMKNYLDALDARISRFEA